jgi:flagellar hook-basal body complex protein FliE
MTTIPGISSQAPLALSQPDLSASSQAEKSFSDILSSTLDQVTKAQNAGDTAIEKLNTGEAKNMHEVMIAVEEADISLRMLVQFRNKALQAYDDIMKMQI